MSDWGNASPRLPSPRDEGTKPPTTPLGEVLLGFRLQGRVINALLMREMTTRFGRDQIGFLWAFFEPLLLSMGIGLLKALTSHGQNYGVPPFIFGVIGYAPFYAFRSIVNSSVVALRANTMLLYHRQIKLMDVMVARNLLQAAVVCVIMVVLIAGAAWLVDMMPHDTPLLVAGLLLMLLFSHGLSLLIASASAAFEATEHLVQPFTYLSLPFSGAFIAMNDLPPSWREVMLWNPQPHFHEMMRDGMFGDLLPAHYSVAYILGWTVALNLLGMFALRAARPRLEH